MLVCLQSFFEETSALKEQSEKGSSLISLHSRGKVPFLGIFAISSDALLLLSLTLIKAV